MKKRLRTKLVENCVGSIGFFGLVVLAFARASAAAPADAAIATDNNRYQNFDVALCVEHRDMRHMASDPQWMEASWNLISHSMKVDKVWLETYRAGE